MKIDLTKYAVNRKFVQNFYREKKERYDLGSAISMCATTTGCPCVVVAFYLGEDIGFTPEVIDAINRFVKFYGYTEFIDAPQSYYEAMKTQTIFIK